MESSRADPGVGLRELGRRCGRGAPGLGLHPLSQVIMYGCSFHSQESLGLAGKTVGFPYVKSFGFGIK